MKTQKKRLIVSFTLAILLLITSSCSKSPMDTSVKASSINEYAKSVTAISKKLNQQEKEKFFYALEILSGDSFEIAVMFVLTGGSSRTREILMESIKQFNAKTPREIIITAEERIAYLKDKLTESGRQVDGKTVQEILEMVAEENIRIELDKSDPVPASEEIHPKLNRRPPTIKQQQARSRAEQELRKVINKSN